MIHKNTHEICTTHIIYITHITYEAHIFYVTHMLKLNSKAYKTMIKLFLIIFVNIYKHVNRIL